MILVKYASRQRPELFKKTIQNIDEMISHNNAFQILVSADFDDATMNNPAMINWCQSYGNLRLIFGHSDSKIHAINRDMHFADQDWKVLINMSDDFKFVEKNWDETLLESTKKIWHYSTDFFAHFNDGYIKDRCATLSIIGREYYLRDGYIYHPDYKSFSCDAEAWYVAIARGRHYYFDRVICEHQHPANAPRKIANDALYARNSQFTDHDTSVYWRRLHNDFDMAKEGIPGPYPWDWEKKKQDLRS